MNEAPIRESLLVHSRNILALSIVISVLTASLVYGAIHLLLVRPMLRLERSMIGFRENPEDASAIISPSQRRDELGSSERELAAMQHQLRTAFSQQARLAALGTAVSRINHDLRNILSSVQLLVDRLEHSQDPQVQRFAPKLVSAVDRAVRLCTNTLRYGRAEERLPAPELTNLYALAQSAAEDAGILSADDVAFTNSIPKDCARTIDTEHLHRTLLNLFRNSVQAIKSQTAPGEVTIAFEGDRNGFTLRLHDTGPGLPQSVRENLFQPFGPSGSADGSGLGLAISQDLMRSNGGKLELKESRPGCTTFEIWLPAIAKKGIADELEA